MPIEAAYMYDAVKIYAEAVHRVLASGHDHRNGTRVIEEVIAAKSYYSDIQGTDSASFAKFTGLLRAVRYLRSFIRVSRSLNQRPPPCRALT